MDINVATAQINEAIKIHGDYALEITESPEEYKRFEVAGTISGKDVRLEITERTGNPQYRYEVWLYNSETGEPLGRGNGGPTVKDAIDIYQWQGVINDLGI